MWYVLAVESFFKRIASKTNFSFEVNLISFKKREREYGSYEI